MRRQSVHSPEITSHRTKLKTTRDLIWFSTSVSEEGNIAEKVVLNALVGRIANFNDHKEITSMVLQ